MTATNRELGVESKYPTRFAPYENSSADVNISDTIGDADELPRLSLQPYNRTVDHYTVPSRRDRFDVNQDYQRGSVWDLERRRNLIRSLLQYLPIGSIIVNDRGYVPGGPDTAIIDGKQRLETLWAFTDDEFAIPLGWLSAEFRDGVTETEPIEYNGRLVRGVRMSALGDKFRRTFENRSLPTLEAQELTYEQEAETFLLINAGGVAQEQATLDRAAEIAGR